MTTLEGTYTTHDSTVPHSFRLTDGIDSSAFGKELVLTYWRGEMKEDQKVEYHLTFSAELLEPLRNLLYGYKVIS